MTTERDAVGGPVDCPVRPRPVVAWLATTPDGEFALALTERVARRRAGDSVDDVVPLTLQAAAQAEIERLRAELAEAVAALPQAVRNERERWETALSMTWKAVDPLRPPGDPGSYARGSHNGYCAALETVRRNLRPAELTGSQRTEPAGRRWLSG